MKKLIFVLLCIIFLATNGCRFHFAEVPVENNAYVVTDELGRTVNRSGLFPLLMEQMKCFLI